MISVQDWQAKGRIDKLNGFDVFHLEAGKSDNPTLLLLHGFPTASWDWQSLWDELSARYHLIALDFPGFGFSEKPRGHKYSIMEQADTVEALIRHHKLSAFHVLAHDYGDTVAQELLARQNEGSGAGQWLSCCLLNGGLFPEQHRALLIQKLLLSPLGPLINKLQTRAKFKASLSSVFGPDTQPSEAEIDAFWSLLNHNDGLDALPRLIHYITDRRTHKTRWFEALKNAAIPLALINGSSDKVSGKHMVDHYLKVIGQPAYLAQLDKIGHYPQVEAPEAVLKHFLAFIAE